MEVIKVSVSLTLRQARQLAQIGESKRCTVIEMIEEAIVLFIERESSHCEPEVFEHASSEVASR